MIHPPDITLPPGIPGIPLTSWVMRERKEVVNSRLEYKLGGEAFRINAASSVIQWVPPEPSAVKTRSTSKFSRSRMALAKQLNLSCRKDAKMQTEGSTGTKIPKPKKTWEPKKPIMVSVRVIPQSNSEMAEPKPIFWMVDFTVLLH